VANLTGWLTGKRPRFLRFNERTYAFNGANRPQCYDGTSWTFCGIAPDSALVAGGYTLSGGALTGTYRYYVAAINMNKRDVRGNPVQGIPVYWGETTPSSQDVRLDAIPATHADTQVTHFRVFRNRNGYLDTGVQDSQQPGAFYYVADVAIGTTTYTDSTTDATLSSKDRITFDHQYAPEMKYGAVYAHRMFGTGYHTFSAGTVTVNATNTKIDLASSTFPDGVLGAWFSKDGEVRKYRIDKRNTTTQLNLEEAFVGSLSGSAYKVFRESHIVWYSKWLDAEAWGPNGEENRYYIEVPAKQEVTGLIEFHGRLLVFCVDRCYWINATDEDDPSGVTIGEDPLWVGMGAVSGDAIWLADGYVYFLSMRGLCRWSGQGQPELLDGLGTDWLDDLAPAQLELCSGGQDPYNGEQVIAAPESSQSENGREYSFDWKTKGWWPDRYTHPAIFHQGRDADGKPVLFYAQQNYIVQRSRGTNDLAPSGDVTGTVDSTTTTTLVDTSATFNTTGNGLAEAYVHIFNTTTHALIGSRRISSNTATELTWLSSGAGGGTLTLAAGQTYFVGPIWWYWKTPVFAIPAHEHELMKCWVGVEPDSGTDRKIYVTETRDGTDKATIKTFTANKVFENVYNLQSGHTHQLKFEVRATDAILSLRDIVSNREVRGSI